MPRPTIGGRPLTNAEKQARYRARRKAEGLKRREAWTGEPDSQAAPEEPPAGVEALRAELAAAKKAQAEAEKKYQSLLRWTQGGEREGKRIAAFTFAAAFVNSDAEKVAALLKTLDIPLYEAAPSQLCNEWHRPKTCFPYAT